MLIRPGIPKHNIQIEPEPMADPVPLHLLAFILCVSLFASRWARNFAFRVCLRAGDKRMERRRRKRGGGVWIGLWRRRRPFCRSCGLVRYSKHARWSVAEELPNSRMAETVLLLHVGKFECCVLSRVSLRLNPLPAEKHWQSICLCLDVGHLREKTHATAI